MENNICNTLEMNVTHTAKLCMRFYEIPCNTNVPLTVSLKMLFSSVIQMLTFSGG